MNDQKQNKIKIMGIPFINKTKESILNDYLKQAVENEEKKFIVTANPEIVMKTREDSNYKKIVQSADLIVPDGIGIVLASKWQGTPIKERVPGIELMEDMLLYADKHKKTCYFLGAKEEVNRALIMNIKAKYPDLIIGGFHHGFFDLNDENIIDRVKESKADFIFVALGYPRQEEWIFNNYDRFNKGIFMGVGGSFDVLSGSVKRAPEKWIKYNLEWLYRLLKQPLRFMRFFVVIKFVFLSLIRKKV